MKTKLALFVTVLAVTLFVGGCASTKPPVNGAVKWNGHWYKHVTDSVSWHAAKKRCENMGGYLVVINNEEENDFVFNLANKNQVNDWLWIGMSDHLSEGTPKWVDGRKVSSSYNNWIPSMISRLNRGDKDFGWMGLFVPGEGKKTWEKRWSLEHNWDGSTSEGERPQAGTTFICEWE